MELSSALFRQRPLALQARCGGTRFELGVLTNGTTPLVLNRQQKDSILSDSDDDSKPASTPKALSDLFGKRASRAILVRIVAFAKATPEEHLAPESLILLLLPPG